MMHNNNLLLQKEQKPFFEANDGGNLPLTWAQTRNMPLTNRVCTMHRSINFIVYITKNI